MLMKFPLRVVFILSVWANLMIRPVLGQTFRNLMPPEGVSISNIRAMVQDRQGFIWFATFDGLFRYDSHSIKQYRHSSTDPKSISSDLLKTHFCDSKGNLWVGGSRGLDRYNRDTDNFTHIDHNLPNDNPESNNHIYFISEDLDHRILIGTAFGMNSLVVSKDGPKVTHILHRAFEGSTQIIGSVSQTSNGDFWAGSFDGLVHVPRNAGQPRVFRISANDKSTSVNQFAVQFLDDKNEIWLGPGSGGIVKFDIATKTFRPILDFAAPNGEKPIVYKIISDGNGKMWIATYSGLALFDPESGKTTWYRNQPGNLHSLPDDLVQSLCLDRQGGLWLGTYLFGITNLYPHTPRFEPWPSTAKGVMEVRYADSFVGINNSGTLWLIEKDQKKIQLFDSSGVFMRSIDLPFPSSIRYYRFYLDEDNTLWALGNSVLTGYNFTTRVSRDYPMVVKGQKDLQPGQVFDIHEDSQGRFWLIGEFGAIQFNKQTGDFIKWKSVTYALSILEDSRQNIWIGGSDQVFLLRRGHAVFEELFTDKGTSAGNFASIWRMAEDRKGRIWAVTRQGLQRFDPQSGKFRIDPKMRGSKFEDIQIDPSGHIWLATEADLTRYHPDKGTAQTYGERDGLPFSGITRPASSVQDLTGRLYFLANEGVFQFLPSQVKAQSGSSRIVFTGLKLSDREIKVGDDTGLLTQNLDQTARVTLQHDQNIFSVNFALLSFPRSERNRYAYRMEGFDDSWKYSGTPSATYMNLPAGDYVFSARAANGDGYWMRTTRQLHIRILPPWWQSWYAYVAYLLIAITSIYLFIRFLWLRSALRKENELHEAKLTFFTNISHEIRTHLSLIVGPLEKAFGILSDDHSAKNHLNYARDNSRTLMELVDELLDFRKIQNGSVLIQVYEHDLVKVIKSVLASFEHLGTQKAIETRTIFPDQAVLLWFDQTQMRKVFYNLLSNAYKFTPEGGNLTVEIISLSGEVSISVTNSGSGIAKNDLEHLFKNFFQVPPNNGVQNGHGIGLALAKEIVDLHKGNLSVTSRVHTAGNDGETSFLIRLRVGQEHYTREQVVSQQASMTSAFAQQLEKGPMANPRLLSQKRQTILLIEDNDELRSFERDLLEEDYRVLEAADGAQGLELAFHHLPDLILCDVMMPELNGVQVCSRIKSDVRTSHIPVILLTARSALSQVLEGLKAGADSYLLKPFDPTILALKISNAIRIREELKWRYMTSMLLDKSHDAGDPDTEFIFKLRDLVIQNIAEPDFDVQKISHSVGMSVSVLYRKLRALTGTTINDFVKNIRMQKALQLIESGKFNVNEVASQVGFEDTKYFSKEFKKIYGRNPSQLKAQPN